MKSQWPMVKLGDVLNYEQPTHYIVNTTQYDDTYPIPVLTAGQTFILGYTNETENIYHKNLPVLIFDDFTTAIKYVDFPFKVKSSAMKILSNDKSKTSIKYLFYAMGRISIDTELHKRYWISLYSNISIPLPPLSVQLQIVQKLDKVQLLIEQRKYQIEKLDLLAKSRFIEMFGDTVKNPKRWETTSLFDFGQCKNGMNFRNGESGVSIHCLGVGDFQNHSTIRDTSLLPLINLDSEPDEGYLLKDDDILFVRSNGNKELVGRCVAVYPGTTRTVYSGFCIRFRQNEKSMATPFLLSVLKSDSIRKKMAGRGANIQNLNQQLLASLLIPVPPKNLQNEFAAFVEQLDKSKFTIHKSLEKLKTLYRALLQEYFG